MILQQIAIRARLIILSPHRSRMYNARTDTYICNALNIYGHNSHGKFIDIKTVFATAFIALYGFITTLHAHIYERVNQLQSNSF